MIHPTAIIHESAVIGDDNEIGPFCVIGPNVVIGHGNKLIAHVCIGTPAQHRSRGSVGGVVIGNGNEFHEMVTVHGATDTHPTQVGNDGYFMATSHIAHDCVIEDGVTLCNAVSLGGHVRIMRGATIGFNSAVHQFQVIGAYSMLGMGTVVPKSARIEPGQCYAGNPARWLRVNEIGLRRAGITDMSAEYQRWSSAA